VERNAQKNATVNLIAAVVAFIAAFAITMFVNSLAGQAASVFLGLAVLVAFTGWFQMRLEENERLEKLELDELARNQGDSALFAAKDSEVFPARRAREQFEKFFVPGFCVLLLLLEAAGAWLLWHWIGRAGAGLSAGRAMPALSLFAIVSLLLFLLGLMSDYFCGRPAAHGSWWASTLYSVTPNWQLFWLADAINLGKSTFHWDYVAKALVYAVCYAGAALAAGAILFEERELG
jgi:hypothetical protein